MSAPTDERWYYSIETAPGQFTQGHDHPNLAITRKLLRNIQLDGMDCLDVGTQEAVVPILLKKAGARSVTAYDRFDFTDKIRRIQGIYGAEFNYINGIQLRDLPARLDAAGSRFFDLVVFSGVLYHLIDPLGLLALVRGFVKLGGLLVIETIVKRGDQETLIFNASAGSGGKGSNYFIPTSAWVEYVLRLLALRPLHGLYLGDGEGKGLARLALLCRSEAAPCPLKPDPWMQLPFHRRMFYDECQVDWEGVASHQSAIHFKPYDSQVTAISDRPVSAVFKLAPYPHTLEEVRLRLNAQL